MSLLRIGIKIAIYFLLFPVCLIHFGCTGGVLTNIHNIRQTQYPAETRAELTLMTLNIRAGGGTKYPGASPKDVIATEENLIKIADAIKSVDPDIVGLQEVRGYNQAKLIAEKLNMNFAYSTHGAQIWWGLAVLSKYKIINIKSKLVNFGGYYGDRIALMCNVDLNGKSVSIINVHYALENYHGQVKATMKFLNKAKRPIILLGDLNRQPFDSEIKPIQDKMIDTCWSAETDLSKTAKTRGTFGGFKMNKGFSGGRRIDYIFVDPKIFKVLDAGLTPEKHYYVSDHRAYWSKIRFKD